MLHNKFEFRNGVKSKNKFVLAPMTNSQSLADGSLGEDELLWLEQRAKGGFGVIITCAAHVVKAGQGWENQLGIYSDKFLPGLTHLAQTLKKYGSTNIVQIYHGGSRSSSRLTHCEPISASSFVLNIPNFEKPRAATVDEIKQITQQFAEATERAYKAGFDGVEIHAANGYLFTQFISTQTNFRIDNYGGNLENRARFLLETLSACKKIVPKNFIVGVRISPENSSFQQGLDIDENLQITQGLIHEGADYVHLSVLDATKYPDKYSENKKALVTLFKEATKGATPIIIAGGITTLTQAKNVINLGADAISLGKIAIGNPSFPNDCRNANFFPNLPPYDREYLKTCMVNDDFFSKLKFFPGLLK